MRQRKRAGQRLSLSASDWNAMLEATDMLLGGKMNRRDNTLSVARGNQDVLGKNTTGQTLPAFSIVGLSNTVAPTPSANLLEWKQQNHQFNLVVPAVPDHLGKWGVLQEPLVNNAVGRVRIAGIAIAHVTGEPPDDGFSYFVECSDNDTSTLEIQYRGTAQVLWKDNGSDWSIIRIGNAWRPHAIRATLTNGNYFEDETASDPHIGGDIIGLDAIWHGDSTVELYNPMEIKLWQGCLVTAHWNVTDQQWEVIAATSNKVVHGIQRNVTRCRFEKLDGAAGWSDWDRNANIPFIKDVFMEGCELVYKTACNDIIPITTLDFVKSVKIGSGSNACQLVYTTCETSCGECTWEASLIDPPPTPGTGLPQLEWIKTGDCSGDCSCSTPPNPPESLNETATTNCSGGTGTLTEYPIVNIDWVTGVVISGCDLTVTKRCSSPVVTSPLSNFVVAVAANASSLYYQQCNGTIVPIIDVGPCPTPVVCGECQWEYQQVQGQGTGIGQWVKISDCSNEVCTCEVPSGTPSIGTTATTTCSEPPA